MNSIIKYIACLFLGAVMLFSPSKLKAQEGSITKTRFLFVLDCSGSMWGEIGKKQKMQVARQILGRLADSLNTVPGVEMALRAYGHTVAGKDCKDTRLEVGFSILNAPQIKEKLKQLEPKGTTPIAYSLEQASGDFPNRLARNIIILITDGLEECKGDPCEVSRALQSKGIIMRPFIIGLGMSQDYQTQFGCVGKFFGVNTEGEFQAVLNNVIAQSLESTTLTVRLMDQNNKPTETDVNMSFYNASNNILVHNFYHTLDNNGLPDTFAVEAGQKYNIVVHTTPPVTKTNVEVLPLKKNVVSINAQQGTLSLKQAGAIPGLPVKVIVKKRGSDEIVYVQDMNTSHKFISGSYDLEVLTLPRMRFNNIQINQSKPNLISIPQHGTLEISYPYNVEATLFVLRDNKQEWLADVSGTSTSAGDIFSLQPGSYKIIYRYKNSQRISDSREIAFKIVSGGVKSVYLD